MIKQLANFNHYTEKSLYWLTAVSTLVFISFVLLGVISRYLTKAPILSSIEMSRLFFVWACFLAATLAYRRNAHIAISFLTDKLPLKAALGLDVFIQILIIVFFVVIGFESVEVVRLLWFTHLPVSGISQSWLYMPVPFTALVIILFSFEKMFSLLKP